MNEAWENQILEKWLCLSSNSENTSRTYRYWIGEFCKMMKVGLGDKLEKWKEVKYDLKKREKFLDELSDLFTDFHAMLKKQGYAPNTIAAALTAIRSFFKHQRIPLRAEHPKRLYSKFHNRDITKEEIKRILQHSLLRDRAFYLMMLESGLRPHTLLSLRYTQIKEDYEANRMPMKIDTPREILKGKYYDGRFSFIGKEAFDSLKEYLRGREPLDDNDLIFVEERAKRSSREALCYTAISAQFSNTVKRLKLAKVVAHGKPKAIRLYCLRKYFRNNAKCDPHFTQFWMGHKLDHVDEHYISRDIERHREEYMKAYQHLTIYEQADTSELERLKKELSERDLQIQALTKAILDIARQTGSQVDISLNAVGKPTEP